MSCIAYILKHSPHEDDVGDDDIADDDDSTEDLDVQEDDDFTLISKDLPSCRSRNPLKRTFLRTKWSKNNVMWSFISKTKHKTLRQNGLVHRSKTKLGKTLYRNIEVYQLGVIWSTQTWPPILKICACALHVALDNDTETARCWRYQPTINNKQNLHDSFYPLRVFRIPELCKNLMECYPNSQTTNVTVSLKNVRKFCFAQEQTTNSML